MRPGRVKSCAPATSSVGEGSGVIVTRGIEDGGDIGSVPDDLVPPVASSNGALLGHPRIEDRREIIRDRAAKRAQLRRERVGLHNEFRHTGPTGELEQADGLFEEDAPRGDVRSPVQFTEPPAPIRCRVTEAAQPDNTEIAEKIRRDEQQGGNIGDRAGSDDRQWPPACLRDEKVQPLARHGRRAILHRHGRAARTGNGRALAAQPDDALRLFLIDRHGFIAVNQRVLHGDDATHIERRGTKRVGDGELVVNLVCRVAIEDDAKRYIGHMLSSCIMVSMRDEFFESRIHPQAATIHGVTAPGVAPPLWAARNLEPPAYLTILAGSSRSNNAVLCVLSYGRDAVACRG